MLGDLAGDNPAVLIYDQLDALRWGSSNAADAIDTLKKIVRNLLKIRESRKNISVIFTCRTFDLENDPEISNWLNKPSRENNSNLKSRKIKVDRLHWEKEVVPLLKSKGILIGSLSRKAKNIIRVPQNLKMFLELGKDNEKITFETESSLMTKFWAHKKLCLINQHSCKQSDINETIEKLLSYTEQTGDISYPSILLNTISESVIGAFVSVGILQKNKKQLSFTHQSYLEFQTGSQAVSNYLLSGMDIGKWLGERSKQKLNMRDGFKYFLSLIQDESPEKFESIIREIIPNKNIRFHLKFMALTLAGQIEAPSKSLFKFLLSLYDDSVYQDHIIFTVFFNNFGYWQWLEREGILKDWFDSDDNYLFFHASRLCWSVSKTAGSSVVKLLRSTIAEKPELKSKIYSEIFWNHQWEQESDDFFALRLELLEDGSGKFGYIFWDNLLKAPNRLFAILKLMIKLWTYNHEEGKLYAEGTDLREEISAKQSALMLSELEEKATEVWETFYPEICRLSSYDKDNDRSLFYPYRHIDRSEPGNKVPLLVVRLLQKSGCEYARINSSHFWEITKVARESESRIIFDILLQSYSGLDSSCSDKAIKWFIENFNKLSSNFLRGSDYKQAQVFVAETSKRCSEVAFEELQQFLYLCWDKWDQKHLKNSFHEDSSKFNSTLRKKYWGEPQYFLLSCLDEKRRNNRINNMIAMLNRRFKACGENYFSPFRGYCGVVSSAIGKDKAKSLSDKQWRRLICNPNIDLKRTYKSKRNLADPLKAIDVEYFARDLAEVVILNPKRFFELALSLPNNIPRAYVSSFLKAGEIHEFKEEAEHNAEIADTSLIEKFVKKFSSFEENEFSSTFCRMMDSRAEEFWPKAFYDYLKELAINSIDPAPDSLHIDCGKDVNEINGHSLINNAINSVRSLALLAIGKIVNRQPQLIDNFKDCLVEAQTDSHPAVRTALCEVADFLISVDENFAMAIFLNVANSDLRIASCYWSQNLYNIGFHRETLAGYLPRLRQLVIRMIESKTEEISEHGATQIAARYIFSNEFSDIIDKHANSNRLAVLKGIASEVAHKATDSKYYSRAYPLLQKFWNHSDQSIRDEARKLSFEKALSMKDKTLINEFVKSEAFHDYPGTYMHHFKSYYGKLIHLAPTIFSICEFMTGDLIGDEHRYRHRLQHDAESIISLILRLYEEAEATNNHTISTKCMDIFDLFLQKRVGNSTSVINQIDEVFIL